MIKTLKDYAGGDLRGRRYTEGGSVSKQLAKSRESRAVLIGRNTLEEKAAWFLAFSSYNL